MERQIDRLQQQVDKNEDRLFQLQNKVAGMDARCGQRHKIALTNKLGALEVEEKLFEEHTKEKEEKLQAKLEETSQTLTNIQIGMNTRCEDVGKEFEAIKADFNQMKERILNLQKCLKKKQKFREQIWFQIVLAVILYVVLYFTSSFFENVFSHSSQKNINVDKTTVIQQIQK